MTASVCSGNIGEGKAKEQRERGGGHWLRRPIFLAPFWERSELISVDAEIP